jgi:hypothetical protein
MEFPMVIFSLQNVLVASAVLCLGMSIVVVGSLYINPRLWLQDYPAGIRAKVPPQTAQEKRMQKFVAVPFLLLMFGIPAYATYLLRMANGGSISFLNAYLNAFFILQIANLFDAVVLDLIVLTFMQPKFATIPGAEGMEYLYRDWSMHLKNFFKGIIICAVLSLPLAAVALL